MAKQPFISHVVNGYSRYDVPESKAFSCTPGILYPARIQFINARDRVRISQGVDVRSNPFAVPTFNPYTVRLHRFFVPLQLYHPEMRTNSSEFDMTKLSLNWLPYRYISPSARIVDLVSFHKSVPLQNSLLSWLRVGNRTIDNSTTAYSTVELPSDASKNSWVNADTFLAYWDIVRNYYSYSQWSLFSFAWPAAWRIVSQIDDTNLIRSYSFVDGLTSSIFTQCFGNLQYLDAYYESQFYPNAVNSQNNTFNRINLAFQIIDSDLFDKSGNLNEAILSSEGFPVSSKYTFFSTDKNPIPSSEFNLTTPESDTYRNYQTYLLMAMPMAVVPSSPDRFSRLLPVNASEQEVKMPTTTIPQLAVAARLQEYKDLLGAGGNRYSDWLETFFASKIGHVDRPKLLFSASQTVNVQVIMSTGGTSNLGDNPLGQQGGAVAFNSRLGRSQSYYFDEPGYLIDMFSIRPVYYWSTISPDYLSYEGADYFNPVYNDIGYQDVPGFQIFSQDFGTSATFTTSVAREPVFNEFRASYDEVLGQLNAVHGTTTSSTGSKPLYSYWVQQRTLISYNSKNNSDYFPVLFTDISSVNSPFASSAEDNFFVNLSYSVKVKNLVNKTFVTRLANR